MWSSPCTSVFFMPSRLTTAPATPANYKKPGIRVQTPDADNRRKLEFHGDCDKRPSVTTAMALKATITLLVICRRRPTILKTKPTTIVMSIGLHRHGHRQPKAAGREQPELSFGRPTEGSAWHWILRIRFSNLQKKRFQFEGVQAADSLRGLFNVAKQPSAAISSHEHSDNRSLTRILKRRTKVDGLEQMLLAIPKCYGQSFQLQLRGARSQEDGQCIVHTCHVVTGVMMSSSFAPAWPGSVSMMTRRA